MCACIALLFTCCALHCPPSDANHSKTKRIFQLNSKVSGIGGSGEGAGTVSVPVLCSFCSWYVKWRSNTHLRPEYVKFRSWMKRIAFSRRQRKNLFHFVRAKACAIMSRSKSETPTNSFFYFFRRLFLCWRPRRMQLFPEWKFVFFFYLFVCQFGCCCLSRWTRAKKSSPRIDSTSHLIRISDWIGCVCVLLFDKSRTSESRERPIRSFCESFFFNFFFYLSSLIHLADDCRLVSITVCFVSFHFSWYVT